MTTKTCEEKKTLFSELKKFESAVEAISTARDREEDRRVVRQTLESVWRKLCVEPTQKDPVTGAYFELMPDEWGNPWIVYTGANAWGNDFTFGVLDGIDGKSCFSVKRAGLALWIEIQQ